MLGFIAAAGVGASAPARAQDWSGVLGVSSDNLYRGISLTDGRPAWLADLHRDLGADWVIGLGASAERPRGQTAGAQLTAYLDRHWQLDEDWAAQAGIVHYDSPSNPHRVYWRYDEINAAIGYRGRWTASVAVSPNRLRVSASGREEKALATFYEATFHQPIAGRLSADMGVGYANLDRVAGLDYKYGSGGLGYAIADARVYVQAVWTGPIEAPYPAAAIESRLRWVASVVWGF